MSRVLIQNALAVATQDAGLGEVKGGDVLIDGSAIAEVGVALKAPVDEVIDATGRVVVPGFINTHHHLYQVLTRNLERVQDAKLFDWLTYLYDIWRHITPEDLHAAAHAGLAELLLTGCTTSADHHYLCPACVEGDLFQAEAEAAREVGIRLHLTRGSMCLGQSAGGLPPDEVVQDEEFILKDSERVIARHHDPSPGSLCRVALAPCSPFSVTPGLMRDTAALARKHQVRLHTHLAETKDEEEFCLRKFGRRPLEHMQDLGWMGPDVWFAHCVHLNDDEIGQLAATGTGVAHCPVSNLRLGSGIAPVVKMLAAGVSVGLAVDGSASNDSSNMLRELQTALLVHRVGRSSDVGAMPARRVLNMATIGGADVLGRNELGVIAPGRAADLAVFDLRGLEYAGATHDPIAALLFCGIDARAELVMVNGEVVVRDKHLVRLDEHSVAERAGKASSRLLQAAGIL
jgi:cytosine/adenosine deaminase-related metal-dependent hydrolase